MLKPDDRLTLLHALRPPPGFALHSAIGTTYSLDLCAMLQAPMAFTGFEYETETNGAANGAANGAVISDLEPLALLQALRQNASRLTVFCQLGAIYAPSRYEPLFTYLEDAIVQVKAPTAGGLFHPKVWAMRYTGENQVLYRLLISSRNLTYDRSWDTLLLLEGAYSHRERSVRDNARLGAFFEALPGLALRPASRQVQSRAAQFAAELPFVEFNTPPPFERVRFFPSGIANGQPATLPDRVDRLLIVSPFVSDLHLQALTHGVNGESHLISRMDSLAALKTDTLAEFQTVRMMNEAALPEAQDGVNPNEGLSGLHAKLYIAETGWDAVVLTGSANATTSAATRNVEFMAELRGRRSQCGMDVFLGDGPGERDQGANKAAEGFGALLMNYPVDTHVPVTDLQRSLERLAQKTLLGIAESGWECTVEHTVVHGETPGPPHYALVLRGQLPALPPDTQIRCWPLSTGEIQARPLISMEACTLRFDGLSPLSVTPLFVFEVRVSQDDQTFVCQSVLMVPLINPPPHHAEAVLAHLLSDAGAFGRMLQLLLAGDEPLPLSTVFGNTHGGGMPTSHMNRTSVQALLEPLLRTLKDAPERLDEIARMMDDLKRTAPEHSVLPASFEHIWEPIWQARQHLRKQNREPRP